MKYVSANDILPEALLLEVQKYVQGTTLYIPSPKQRKKKWGEMSGQRAYLKERNEQIRQQFEQGVGVEALAEAYFLSLDSIKKIVYRKQV